MATLAAALARARRQESSYVPPLPEEGPGFVDTLLSGAQPVFDLFEGVARLGRAAAGRALDIQGSQQVLGIPAPSGEELFKALTGLPLPENVPGKVEWRDVPGFLTELAFDPAMYLGIGELSKAGQAAARLSKLERGLGVLERGGKALARARPGTVEDIAKMRKLVQELRKGGVVPKAETLAEQARLGQRSLLSVGVPFTRVNLPLLPRAISAKGLGAMGALGRGVSRLASPVTSRVAPLFRVGGRIAPKLAVRRGGMVFSGRDYNAIIEAKDILSRHLHGRGLDQAQATARALEALDPELAEASRAAMIREVRPLAARALEESPALEAIRRRLLRAKRSTLEKPADPVKVARLERRLKYMTERLRRVYDPTIGLERVGAPAALHTAGVERGVATKLIERRMAALTEDYMRRIDEHAFLSYDAMVAGDKRAFGRHQGAITRLKQSLDEKLADLARKKQITERVWANIPDVLKADIKKYTLLTDDILGIARQLGIRVEPLDDLELGYLHHAINPEAILIQRQLADAGLKGPFVRYARVISPEKGFTRPRIPEFRGMGVLAINDWWEQRVLSAIENGLPIKLPGKRVPSLFAEDPSEIILRRLTQEGYAEGAAAMHRGIIEAFAVPEKWAREGDTSIPEYLEASKLGRIGEFDVPKKAKAIAKVLKGTKYEGKVIPAEFAEEALKVHSIFNRPDELAAFSRFMDKYLSSMRYSVTSLALRVPKVGMLPGAVAGGAIGGAISGLPGAAMGAALGGMATKIGALPIFPVFHHRNELTNAPMMWLAGFKHPSVLHQAWRIMDDAEKGLIDPLLRLARDHGAYGGTYSLETAEVAQRSARFHTERLPRALRGFADAIFNPTKTVSGRRGIEFGAWIENHAKLSLFLDGLKSGLTPAEAGERVAKYLFDYRALSRFEKAYLRKWAYFYTFARKMTPLLWSELVNNPRKMRILAKALGYMGDTAQKELLRSYQAERGYIPWGVTEEGKRRFMGLGLPLEQLMLTSSEGRPGWSGVARVGQKILAQAAPHLGRSIEAVTGKRLMSGKDVPISQVWEGATPLSRVLSTYRTLRDIKTGKRPPGYAWRLFGGTPVEVSPRKARIDKQLERLDALLEAEFQAGRARKFPTYSPLYGRANERLRQLSRLRAKLQRQRTRGY